LNPRVLIDAPNEYLIVRHQIYRWIHFINRQKLVHPITLVINMKIGYPCTNTSIERHSSSTFRLACYSEKRLIQTVRDNLIHLHKILKYNVHHHLRFFRISSNLIPFASHPICKFNWINHFKSEFRQLGQYIKANNIRISCILINLLFLTPLMKK
jgi:UV DNA damage repair endonuclease